MEVIPAIDLLDQRVVRLRQGRYDDVTVYDDDPARLAGSWSGHAQRLHVVDLLGARDGRPVQGEIVRRIAQAFGPGVEIGGGVRSAASSLVANVVAANRSITASASDKRVAVSFTILVLTYRLPS